MVHQKVAFGDYGKMFKVKTNDLFKRVDVSSISEIFIDSTRELRLNNNGMYILCPMTVEKSPIKEEQAIIIQKLADILVKFKILEQKYNVKFSGCTPNLVYSLIGGTGKYMDISQMLVTDTDKIKTTVDEINPYVLYDSPVDGSLCRLEKGIKWIFIGGVDNVLLKMADVTLLGMAKKQGVQIASKSVVKANPHEKVGVFCRMNGHPKVIEYAELPEKMAEEIDQNGELKYGESHIMCNLFSLEAIEKASTKELKYHVAVKKIKYIDENGKLVNPTEPNCYKFEKFVFDSFGLFDEIAILRGKREEDFAPIKNAEGQDSPETAQKLYENYMAKNV